MAKTQGLVSYQPFTKRMLFIWISAELLTIKIHIEPFLINFMPSSKAHFSKRSSSTHKSKTSVYLVNFASDTQSANFVKISLSSLLNFCCVRCVLNGSTVEIAIDRNRIVKVSKCKANGVMLFGPMILSVCQLNDTEDCDICRGVRVGFKLFEVRINTLFGGRWKLIAGGRRWVILAGRATLRLRKPSCDSIYSIVNVSHPINFNHVALAQRSIIIT